MHIEHKTDRNSKAREPDMMRDITNIQAVFVADHIAALRREGDALRAERERARRIEAAAARGDTDPGIRRPARRVRFGRWLVAFGEAIGGSTRSSNAGSRAVAAASGRTDDPCGDNHDRLAPAA
jgi:hypothetical protein